MRFRFALVALLMVAGPGCAALGGPQAQSSGPIKLGMVTSLPGMLLRAPAVFSYAVYGLVLVLMMWRLPQGVVPAIQRRLPS
jgi:ABC-type branched-subunit amino acid transport system permease subunit